MKKKKKRKKNKKEYKGQLNQTEFDPPWVPYALPGKSI